MDKLILKNPNEHKNPIVSFLVLILFLIGGVIAIGPVLASLSIILYPGLSIMSLADIMQNPTQYPEYRDAFLLFQGAYSFGAFVVPALLYQRFYEPQAFRFFKGDFSKQLVPYLLTFIIVMSFMAVNSFFIEINAEMDLPAFMDQFESFAKKYEEKARVVTEYLTTFDSTTYFLAAIVVIAVIPGLGEELIFRGLLQNIVGRWSKNVHVGIWVSAFLFSAIHFQFYGFLPRMMLGALFGYLYLWSGSLMIPVFAHFLNNAASLVLVYLYQVDMSDYDASETESAPGYVILTFTVFTLALLYYFRKVFKEKSDGSVAKDL